MAAKFARSIRQAGQDWLLSCARNPADVLRWWAAGKSASIASGEHWRVAEGPLLRSVVAMKCVCSRRLGPVLADASAERAWWLLPPELGDDLDSVPQLMVHPIGWPLTCPPVLYAIDECFWLEPPDGSSHLTDPPALTAAFAAGGRLSAEALG
ncbi:hypothetical protein F7R91_28135 [Streptomyces luteolifulvus]|uniref:Uncharacterized protein n=1 Tax=Streptomyces luteolifulvus TaxID=2615112 RepID=A0A6H9UVK7_9ACTN|nr:hypothetical protein [Streptomyces luteolifulvus]KAB1142670.1 hypothetical protein F7R91_28135 [Streptomyces luteolifulvus]